MTALPTDTEKDELMLSCRYGDIDDIKLFVEQFGNQALVDTRDGNGNCVLHMVCANGHTDVLDYLLPSVPPSLLAAQNASGSTPLHWAALNSHLDVIKKMVLFENGPGIDLIDIKNSAGHSPLAEAEFAGWDEGASWLVGMMKLDPEQAQTSEGGNVPEDDEDGESLAVGEGQKIEVEIEDANGQIAKMTIGGEGNPGQSSSV